MRPLGRANVLGDALLTIADLDGAREAWQEALIICEALRIPQASQVRQRLASLS